jgi:hypothetical protein
MNTFISLLVAVGEAVAIADCPISSFHHEQVASSVTGSASIAAIDFNNITCQICTAQGLTGILRHYPPVGAIWYCACGCPRAAIEEKLVPIYSLAVPPCLARLARRLPLLCLVLAGLTGDAGGSAGGGLVVFGGAG